MSDDPSVLGTSAGVVRREDRIWVEVRGADRADYLQRMLTQDIIGIGPAHVRSACLLNPKGRILANLLVWNAGDRYAMDLPRDATDALPTLEKYVILEDTVFEPLDTVRLDVVGPEADGVLARAGLSLPDRGACRSGELGGGEVHVLRIDLGRRPRFLLALEPERVPAAIEALDVPQCPLSELDVARVEEGVPAYGREISSEVLFNEPGLGDAVSWSKGCFPGQEPVVMALDRGHPPRSLCVFAAEGGTAPPPGTPLVLGDTAVGQVTSAAMSPLLHGVRALGYVRHAEAHVGTELSAGAAGLLRIVRVRRLTRG